MSTSEFKIFCQLLNEVHYKAFGEPLATFDQTKAKALSWFIYQATGDALSYKTLYKFMRASIENTPVTVNPSETTMGILAHFVDYRLGEPEDNTPRFTYWYRYRRMLLGTFSLVA